MANNKIEQFRVDNVRQELDCKIEKKLSGTAFTWTIGILVTVLLFAAGFLLNWIMEMNDRMTRVETTIAERQNHK